jgi:hypothetical protein
MALKAGKPQNMALATHLTCGEGLLLHYNMAEVSNGKTEGLL